MCSRIFRQPDDGQPAGRMAEANGAHHDLGALHAFSTALQTATSIEEVQEEVLTAVTAGLRFRRAIVGVVDEQEEALTGWLGVSRDGEWKGQEPLAHPARIPLSPAGGPVAQAVLGRRIGRVTDAACSNHRGMNEYFGVESCLILPLLWGIRPAGVLLVDARDGQGEEEVDGERLRSLEALARQAALVLGTMRARVRHARESAIKEERARIAQDMHDTVSQSLFGLVYTLDGCLKLLDRDRAAVRAELEGALRAAEEVRRDLRQAIMDMWPDEEMTSHTFEAGLLRYATDVLQASHPCVRFDVRGDFGALSSRAQRSLYRIAQEALTNVVHHATAEEVEICVDVADGRGRLVIRDDGRGFEPQVALAQAHGQEHFGLRGMMERAHSLGGTCDVFSRPGAGTSIVIDIPAGTEQHDT